MQLSALLRELIEALKCLPGVGPKSAQRMAVHLLEKDPKGALRLAQSVNHAVNHIGQCRQCRMLSESDLCEICQDPRRDGGILCIVETCMDLMAIEQSGSFDGRYFVLMGRLSPLDGIGPDELRLDQLQQQLMSDSVQEIILATSPTVEGETTANYIIQMAQIAHKRISKIAYGVPFGGELEYVDGHTLSHALSRRQVVEC